MTNMVPNTWQLPQRFRDRLGDEVGRQRLMVHAEHLLLVLHAPPATQDRHARLYWREPSGAWHGPEAEPGQGPGPLLAEYDSVLEALEAEEDRAVNAQSYFGLLQRLTPLHRAVRNLQEVLQRAREVRDDDPRLLRWRDEAYTLERRAELLMGDARHGLAFIHAANAETQAQEAQDLARSGHRLNVLAALFLPLATLATVLGMNVPSGMEGLPPPGPFLVVVSTGVVAGWAVKAWNDRPG